MAIQIYLQNWYDKFLDEIKRTKRLRIVSPFVKETIVREIQKKINFKNVELITRYSLRDFASGVSSIDALKFSIESGAKVYGIKDLHSKIYLFDDNRAIVSSANLTTGGLVNNYECGLFLTKSPAIRGLIEHFDELKNIDGKPLTIQRCNSWSARVKKMAPQNTDISGLPDYGATKTVIDEDVNYYIKFFGKANERGSLDFPIRQVLNNSLCHNTCGYSKDRKPRQIKDGDIIYMARIIKNPNDYAIFGKATAIKFKEKRDRFTKAEIIKRSWRKKYPICLRVKDAVFIEGTLSNGIMLSELMNTLDYDSFVPTKRRYDNGERDINPKRSFGQKPSIHLTERAAQWLESRFQNSLDRCGQVGVDYINTLPLPIKLKKP